MQSSTFDATTAATRPFRPAPAAPRAWRATAVRADRLLLAALTVSFLAYSAGFIYRTSFVVDGERYFSLFDDAMVSMRYAKNFADGHGLVWNPGERVEGYTNPLWTLYMGLLHLLPVPPSKTSLLVQATAAIFLLVNLYYVRRLGLAISGSRAVAWGSVAMTAVYLPITFWSLQGMEVSVLVLLLTSCAWLAIRGLDTGSVRPALYLLLGLGTFTRPDMVVPFAAFLAFLLAVQPEQRRKHAVWAGLIFVAAVAAQTLFRVWYYGDVFPNTYYLKVTGVPAAVRIERGVYVLLQFIWHSNPLMFVVPAILVFRRDRRIWLLFWIVAGQMAYSVYVGGDAWEYWGGSNRYIAIVMPAFFVLLAFALHVTARAVAGLIRFDDRRRVAGISGSTWAFVALVLFAIVSMNTIHGPAALAEAALLRPTLHTGPGGSNQGDVEEAMLLRAATTPDASIAVIRAGTIPYFVDRRTIDLLGKNDAVIAHGPVNVPTGGPLRFQDFRPGHMKYDFAYSIGRLAPDVIVHLRRRTALAKPFLDAGRYKDVLVSGRCVYVRRDSPRILWNRLPGTGCPATASDEESPAP